MAYKRVLIVGLGLIGGSFLKRVRESYPDTHIIGMTRKQAVLDEAKSTGLLQEAYTQASFLKAGPKKIDAVFVATPISFVLDTVHALSEYIDSDCVFVDMSSTKKSIEDHISLKKTNHYFFGGHPLAGSHKQGFDASSAELLDGARMVLTGPDHNQKSYLSAWLKGLNMRVLFMDSSTHDELLAISSHVPYFMSLLCLAPVDLLDEDKKKQLTQVLASGFRDTTRIAASDPNWACELCEHNKDAILTSLERIKTVLDQLTDAISSGDQLGLESIILRLRETKQRLS